MTNQLESKKESITIKEARKLLGSKYKHLPDETILALIKEFDHLASIVLGFP